MGGSGLSPSPPSPAAEKKSHKDYRKVSSPFNLSPKKKRLWDPLWMGARELTLFALKSQDFFFRKKTFLKTFWAVMHEVSHSLSGLAEKINTIILCNDHRHSLRRGDEEEKNSAFSPHSFFFLKKRREWGKPLWVPLALLHGIRGGGGRDAEDGVGDSPPPKKTARRKGKEECVRWEGLRPLLLLGKGAHAHTERTHRLSLTLTRT